MVGRAPLAVERSAFVDELLPRNSAEEDQNRGAKIGRFVNDANDQSVPPGLTHTVLDRVFMGQERQLLTFLRKKQKTFKIPERTSVDGQRPFGARAPPGEVALAGSMGNREVG
jgi:hypothetical protein